MVKEKQSHEREELVVFSIVNESQCSECSRELWRGSLITLEKNKALCLSCADLDYLWFLPSGNAALTRRTSKYSKIHPIVVRWSRARKRYERQGILAEPEAIERAEQECLADAEIRDARRKRAAQRRAELDEAYVVAFAQKIRQLYPNCPSGDEVRISEHACQKYSGRVGRSAAAKQFDDNAIQLAVVAHIRHQYTRYDELLFQGWSRGEARAEVKSEINEILAKWQ
ncbi:MAG: DUF2293 domain-containing protein [bacterium]|nr:MAG: DUF2293 domain-containing protein [bacterium]